MRNTSSVSADLYRKTGIGRAVQILLLVSIITNLLLAVKIAATTHTTETYLVPPTIEAPLRLESGKITPDYLELMGPYIVGLRLSRTPSTTDAIDRTLLRNVSPASHVQLSQDFAKESRIIKENQVTSYFTPRGTALDPDGKSISVTGIYTRRIGEKIVDDSPKAIKVSFAWQGSKIFVEKMAFTDINQPLKEVSNKDEGQCKNIT